MPARKPKAPPRHAVVLSTPEQRFTLDWPDAPGPLLGEMQRSAISWTHVARNRLRWNSDESTVQQRTERAAAFLARVGIGDTELQALASAPHVEVQVPFHSEEAAWEARILPWEVLLSAATRDRRTGPVTITRQLVRPPMKAAPRTKRVLYVESAPAPFGAGFDFSNERELVRVTSGASAADFTELPNPTLEQLVAALRLHRPHIVHLAGFDNHQAQDLVDDDRGDRERFDGYALSDARGRYVLTDAEALATAFQRAGATPDLVFCNLWNSAARVAPMLVANGVRAAIGFQDTFDDGLSELFCGRVYQSLAEGSDLGSAFSAAHLAVRDQPIPIRGSGVVLWSATSLVASTKSSTVGQLTSTFELRARESVSPLQKNAAEVARKLTVEVTPPADISYALLHNRRDLFPEFYVRKLTPERIDGVNLRVELHVGAETCAYRGQFTLTNPIHPLAPEIRLPLTSVLARSIGEELWTTLYVEVTWGSHSLHSRTYPVRFVPVEQWDDTDRDRQFLPSFVYPRDPAVARIVGMAQKYAVAIRDDPNAGWEGYQGVSGADSMFEVDDQAQALWYAMMYESAIAYINPPPSYAPQGQRIRNPSTIYAEQRGTCIDLALLTASCLEYVEIYPVVFLLEGHAFPGYWRSEAVRDAFRSRVNQRTSDAAPNALRNTAAEQDPAEPWLFPKAAFREIKAAVDRSHLIPLESVGLTERTSFSCAIDRAKEYFDSPAEFHSMIDIQTARTQGVTPLPLAPAR